MASETRINGWKDKVLFTPGPLTTSRSVKQALLRDLGSRDYEFVETIREVRRYLVELGGVSEDEYTTVPMQGSGTFTLEAVVSSAVPRDGKMLIVINGAYGKRLALIASMLEVDHVKLEYQENETPKPADIDRVLSEDPAITHVSVVHCETTSGIFNPIKEIGQIVRKHDRVYYVDAMSSFGAVPVNLKECEIDYLVSSSNKCIEGVPGFGYLLARRATLEKTEGYARSLSFDLYAQWKALDAGGQFRFTPPTHSIVAFRQALLELKEEGGVEGRAKRYKANNTLVREGMKKLGFKEYLRPEDQGYIITSFHYPTHPNFSFERFYGLLNDQDYVIYPGKVGTADCFRIGNIGRIFASDVQGLLNAIRQTLETMNVDLPIQG